MVAHRGVRRYRTTYGELADLAGRFSAELARRGVGPGERVVLWGANSAEWVGVFFGCLLRGVLVVPLDAAGSAEFAARVIADVKPRLVVGDVARFEGLGSRFEEGARGEGVSESTSQRVSKSARGFDDLEMAALGGIAERLPEKPLFTVDAAVGPDAPFQIVFTSGTTAEPRGIVHTHRNILVTLDPIEREIAKYRRFERPFHPLRFLHSLPLSHVFGQFMGLWTPALLGEEVHFAEQLDPSRIADVIRCDRISVLIAVPRVLHLLRGHLLATVPGLAEKTSGAKAPDSNYVRNAGTEVPAYLTGKGKNKYGDSGASLQNDERRYEGGGSSQAPKGEASFDELRTGSGAACTPTRPQSARTDGAPSKSTGMGVGAVLKKWWHFRRVHRALGWKFWAIISGGATLPADLESFYNTIGVALIQGYGMTETAALVTLNHPFHIAPGTIGKTLPGREVKIGEDGEILVRGAMLSGATWQQGAMHAREGEWLATGDLAEESAHGELKFLGRKGDLIVTGAGLNIHPADLEAALTAQPGIRAAAVVACEFAGGPEPVAVVLTALDDAGLGTAVAGANRTLAEFQQMRRVLRWPEPQFPYTSTGKLVRRKVTEWVRERFKGRGSRFEVGARGEGDKAGDALMALIAEVTGEPLREDDGRIPPIPQSGMDGARTHEGASDDSLRLSEDLHLDSLGRVQLQSVIEQRFAIDIDDDAMATAGTVGELRKLMGGVLIERSGGSIPLIAQERAMNGARIGEGSSRQVTEHPQVPNLEAPGAPGEGWASQDKNIYPRWPWTWPVRWLRMAFIECAMRPFVWLMAKPRVVYEPGAREALSKTYDPLVLISNHITAYDGALVLYALPGRLRRRVAAAMSGEMLRDYRDMRNQGAWILNLLAPAAYWLLTALFNVFPLPRDRGFRRSFAHAGEAMDRGYSVLIFPEGTRSLTGHMNRFRSGIGLLARDTQATVLPIALRGIYDLVAKGEGTESRARWFHAGRIEIRVGAPVTAEELSALGPAAIAARLEDALRRLVESDQSPPMRIP